MVFGSVFEVSFRASAVFCAFGIESIGVIGGDNIKVLLRFSRKLVETANVKTKLFAYPN